MVYKYQDSKDVPVQIHTHDRNLTINKFVCEQSDALNQNDAWHGIKGLKKSVTEISIGYK